MLTLHTSSRERKARLRVREREVFPDLPQLHAAPLEVARRDHVRCWPSEHVKLRVLARSRTVAGGCVARSSSRRAGPQRRNVLLTHVDPELPARELDCEPVDKRWREHHVHKPDHVLSRHVDLLRRVTLHFVVVAVVLLVVLLVVVAVVGVHGGCPQVRPTAVAARLATTEQCRAASVATATVRGRSGV